MYRNNCEKVMMTTFRQRSITLLLGLWQLDEGGMSAKLMLCSKLEANDIIRP
jgi:hypothetical protein